MKLLRSMMMWLLVLGIALFVASSAFAADKEHDKGNHEALIKTLRSSAAALQLSHPDLAAKLTESADRKAKKIKALTEKNEKEEKGEKVEPKGY